MKLIKPTTEYKESYLDFVRAFQADAESDHHVTLRDYDVAEVEGNFSEFVQNLHDREAGQNLPAGYVPDTHWWAMINNEVVGQISLRHQLTPALREHGGHIGYAVHPAHRGQGIATAMLKKILVVAKAMGIEQVLIGCDKDNPASARVIEKCGGVFEKESSNPHADGKPTLLYWVKV